MDVDQVSLLLGLLTFLALAIGVVCLGALAMRRVGQLRPYADLLVPLAAAIALVCTLGSLYYSGVQHYRPCRLCWWQRIMMYPLVPVLGVGALRRDRAIAYYALPLSIIGLGYSTYHTQLQWFPDQGETCDPSAPCTAVWVDTFDFISIPFMAFAGFLAITGLLGVHVALERQSSRGDKERAHMELEEVR